MLLHRWSGRQPRAIHPVVSAIVHCARLRPGIGDHLLRPLRLLVERPRSKRRLALREKALVVQVCRPCNRRRDVALQTPQGVACRRDRQASRHKARLTELLSADTALKSCITMSEFIAANRGDSTSYTCVIFNAANVGEAVASAEKRIEAASTEVAVAYATKPKAIDVDDVNVGDVDERNAVYAEAPPRSEEVTGAAGQPAHVAESEPKIEVIAPPEE